MQFINYNALYHPKLTHLSRCSRSLNSIFVFCGVSLCLRQVHIIILFICFCLEVKAAHPKNNKRTHTITPLCHDKSAFDVVEAEQSRVTTAQCILLTGAVLFGEIAAAGGTSLLFDLF